MDVTLKQFTEPIFAVLADARARLVEHPLLAAARRGELPRSVLLEFAWYQYSDSILWVPMLAQMKSKATRSPRLRRAIADNIAHEAGLGETARSHVTLAVEMMRSLGVRSLEPFPTATLSESATLWLSDDFADFGEPEIAGFLLGAETLVPEMFAAFVPAFRALGGDTAYLREHVAVDTDEHAAWMSEAVAEVARLYGEDAVERILAGLHDACAETREVPDRLWSDRCASH